MNFERLPPSPALAPFIECYWQAESDNPAEQIQKIIPDGYPEMIFHYRSPFCIMMGKTWETQDSFLIGGQIRKYFFLKNTGPSGMFGIKFKETCLNHLFSLPMHHLTDRVPPLSSILEGLESLCTELVGNPSFERQVDVSENFLKGLVRGKYADHVVDKAVGLIRNSSGTISVSAVCEHVGITERSLERGFHTCLGLTPKFYSRIIRFNKIFELVQQEDPSWGDLVYETGYYDQSHFIRNFKAFTGEDPTKYLFSSPSLANFFARPNPQVLKPNP